MDWPDDKVMQVVDTGESIINLCTGKTERQYNNGLIW